MTEPTGFSARAPWRTGLLSALLTVTLSACGGGDADPTGGSDNTAPPPADLADGGGTTGTGGSSTPTDPTDPNATLVPDPVSTLNASIEDRRIVVLTWPASSRATRYDLYWSPVAGLDPQTAQRIANVTSPFSHTEVDGGLPYHYIITATNAAGTSAPSGEVTVTVPPSAIQGLSLTAGDSVVDLTWSGATGATHYLVYWSNDPDTVLSSGQVVRVEVPALTHSGLQNSATYHYRVSAVGAGGEGPVSAQLAGQPETPVPGAPGAFSIAIHPDDSRSAILSWEAPEQPLRPEDILLYNVYRFSSTEAATLVAQTYAGLFIDTPPVAGVPWSYRVSAVTVAGEGPASATISITTSSSEDDNAGDSSGIPEGVFDCGEPTECWAPQR